METSKIPAPLLITLYPRDETVTEGHDMALTAWLSQSDGKSVEQAAAALTDDLVSYGMRFNQDEMAAVIYGAVKLLIQFAGIPEITEGAAA